MNTSRDIPPDGDGPYTMVWNDAVDLRQLTASVVICVGIGLPGFLGARALFAGIAGNAALAGGYALLVGLVGCVLAAALCARLFPPKRTFDTEEGADHGAALAELARMGGTRETFDGLPSDTRAEMIGLGLAPETEAAGEPTRTQHHARIRVEDPA